MKKLIAVGISAVSAATLTVGAVGTTAAHADDPTSAQQVCDAIPGILGPIVSQVLAATTNLETVNAALSTAQDAMTAALGDYADAVVAWVNALDGTGSVTTTQAIMDARLTDLVNKVVDWAGALTDQFDANVAVAIAQLQDGVVSQIGSGLSCGL